MADKPEFITEIEALIDRRYPLEGTTHYAECYKTHVGCATRKVIDEYMSLLEEYNKPRAATASTERDDEPCSKSSGMYFESSFDSPTTSSSSQTPKVQKETPKGSKKRTKSPKKEQDDGHRSRRQGDERNDAG